MRVRCHDAPEVIFGTKCSVPCVEITSRESPFDQLAPGSLLPVRQANLARSSRCKFGPGKG